MNAMKILVTLLVVFCCYVALKLSLTDTHQNNVPITTIKTAKRSFPKAKIRKENNDKKIVSHQKTQEIAEKIPDLSYNNENPVTLRPIQNSFSKSNNDALKIDLYQKEQQVAEYYDQKIVTISPQIALPIGIKIWFNESGGKIEGLTCWNKGENFASLGIGHFLWHPSHNKKATFSGGFPQLIRYIEERGGTEIPEWFRGKKALHCPWNSRAAFLKAKNSQKMKELRDFLQRTIPIQAEFMSRNLQEILPDLLSSTPMHDREYINNTFYNLAKTPAGIYAMVDYMNFKGPGISNSMENYKHGTGLLHVLKGMRDAPPGSSTLQAYVWSAKNALIKRVDRSPSAIKNARWLTGWFKRVDTYLEGDTEVAEISNEF